jgi:L-iditol 2-dehydrogenase
MALMAEKRFDAAKIHTHTFALADLPTALRYARDRVEDAIKVVSERAYQRGGRVSNHS